MLIGFASRQASKYAEDLSESVRRSKHRQAQRGEHLGGPLPLGYVKGSKQPAVDPEHAPTVELIFALAFSGMPDSALARAVNAEGYRTRVGRPFDRRAIQAIVCNTTYAALVVHEGDQFEAQHETLVDRDAWRTIQEQRQRRDLGSGRHKAGRPARRHLLTSLATCGICGSPMYTVTSSHMRKDGTRARQYQCRGYRSSDGTCFERFDAEEVDTSVLESLHRLVPDFTKWIGEVEVRHDSDRQRLADVVERAEQDRDAQAGIVVKHERRYRAAVAQDDPKADLMLDFVQEARQETRCGRDPARRHARRPRQRSGPGIARRAVRLRDQPPRRDRQQDRPSPRHRGRQPCAGRELRGVPLLPTRPRAVHRCRSLLRVGVDRANPSR
jgi:hypothetical protein